jgi:cell wall-associated NlpC family hydrolase
VKKKQYLTMAMTGIFLLSSNSSMAFAKTNYVNNYIPDNHRSSNQSDCATQDTSSSGESSSVNNGASGLSDPKTKAYAEQIVSTLKSHGLSGSAIAGILGNALHEDSDLNPMRAEQTTTPIYFSSPTSTTPPAGMNIADGGGGAGIYQITPYTKYIASPMWSNKSYGGGTGGWTADGETMYMLEYGLSDEYLANSRGGIYASQGGLVDSSVNSKEKMLQAENSIQGVRNSAQAWEIGAEGPRVYSTAQLDLAVVAYNELNLSSIKADPNKIKELLGGAGNSDSSNNSSTPTSINDCQASSGTSDSNIVNYAKSLLGYFTYEQSHGVSYIGSVANPSRDGVTDCSGFVWLVLAHLGYKVPENMGWYTGSMESDAKGAHEYLKEIPASEAGAGDIVIVNTGGGSGNAGHTAILEAKWESAPDQSNETPVIEEGGEGGSGGVTEGHFADSFGALLNGTLGAYSITFARPVSQAGSQTNS